MATRVTYDVKIVVNNAAGGHTSAAVSAAIQTAVAALGNFVGPAVVTVQTTSGSATMDIAVRKIPPTYKSA